MTDHTTTYGSLVALAAAGKRQAGKLRPGWADFADVDSWEHAEDLALHGWQGVESDTLEIVESAVALVEAEHDELGFTPVWDVAGCEVDVGRYLSGEPENMIDYHIVPVPKVGRVITLCASVSVSCAVRSDALKRRGYGIAALAFALSRLGFSVELWADLSATKGATTGRIRVLVKGANDELDPARVMFAYAHPAMLRGLCFAGMHAFPHSVREALGVGRDYGCPADPKRDLPDGTIYLPCVFSEVDIPDPEYMVRGYFSELGII